MRNLSRSALLSCVVIVVIVNAGGALISSGCKRRVETATGPVSRGAEERAVVQFAAVAGPGEERGATEYEFGNGKLHLKPLMDFRIGGVSEDTDELGYPALRFEIVESQKEDFRRWTADLINQRMAILLDGKVLTAPIVHSALPGIGVVELGSRHWTEEEVRDIVARIRIEDSGTRR